MPVSRLTTGLSFEDSFNRANGLPGANYVPNGGGVSGPAVTAIVGNKLRVTGYGSEQVVQTVGAPSLAEALVQWIVTPVSGGSEVGLITRMNTSYYMAQFFGVNLTFFRPPGYTAIAGVAVGALTPGVDYVIQIYTAPLGEQKVWQDGVLRVSETNSSAGNTPGFPGFRCTVGQIDVDSLIVCVGRTLSVSGLTTGFSARVKSPGGSVVAGPVIETAGIATIPMGGVTIPFGLVEILNASSIVVDSWEGVGYAGDTFLYEPPVTFFRTASIAGGSAWEECP